MPPSLADGDRFVTGLVLGAGGSVRLGRPKQLLAYGEGTLRAEPLKQALRKFRRTANVISESPDLESSLAIQAVLASARTPSRRTSSSAASSSRPRSRRY